MCQAFCIITADLTHTPFEKYNHPHFIKGQDSHHSGSQRQACIGMQVNPLAKARLLPPSSPAHQLLSRGLCWDPSVTPGCCTLATSISEIPKLKFCLSKELRECKLLTVAQASPACGRCLGTNLVDGVTGLCCQRPPLPCLAMEAEGFRRKEASLVSHLTTYLLRWPLH